MTTPFRPEDHLIDIKSGGKVTKYLPVQWRLVWFRLENPNAQIDTEEIFVDLDRECTAEQRKWNEATRRYENVQVTRPGYSRFKATITTPEGGRATGTKSESAANFPDFIEKAESGAIGRALAALGYGTQFADIEFAEGERLADSPVGEASQPPQEPMASPEQIQELIALHEAFGIGMPERPFTAVRADEVLLNMRARLAQKKAKEAA